MTSRNRWLAVLASLLVAGGALWGCNGDDGGNDGQNFVFDTDTGEEDVEEDVDPGDPCEDVECEEGEICVEGVCQGMADPGYSCAEPYDLGVLDGGLHTLNPNPGLQPNLLATGCAAEDASPEAVIRFEVAQAAVIHVNTDRAFEDIPIPVMAREIRQGSCVSQDAAVECTINPLSVEVQPGEEYYLVLEANQGIDINEFVVELEVQELACSPAGQRVCEDGEVTLCFAGMEERVSRCADACDGDGENCLGDSCANPIEVTASQTFTGDFGAYRNEFDFSDSLSCSTEGTTGVNSPGRDVVFRLPGLTAGDTVEVDKGDLGAAVIGLMSSCSQTPTCVVGDTTTGVLTWTVTSDGDYYVVISPRTSASGEFTYSISID